MAVLLADLHLSIRPPAARSNESNWFNAMLRPWREINRIVQETKAVVLCAGDVFDKWNPPPELINWAIEVLPEMYGIPGNHDLPNHRPELVHRSAFGTLVRAGKIQELDSVARRLYNLDVYGKPFGEEIPVPESPHNGRIKVLITHQYLWTDGSGHIDATEETKLSTVARDFRDFDIVASGDNHVAFDRRVKGGTYVFNCGGLMRRKVNEVDHEPRVGLVHADGRVTSRYLNTEADVLDRTVDPVKEVEDEEIEVEDFVAAVGSLEASDLSFREAVERTMESRGTGKAVRELIMEAMG